MPTAQLTAGAPSRTPPSAESAPQIDGDLYTTQGTDALSAGIYGEVESVCRGRVNEWSRRMSVNEELTRESQRIIMRLRGMRSVAK